MITKVLTTLRLTTGKSGRFRCGHPTVQVYEDTLSHPGTESEMRVVCLDCGKEWSK